MKHSVRKKLLAAAGVAAAVAALCAGAFFWYVSDRTITGRKMWRWR